MSDLPALSGKRVFRVLLRAGFQHVRTRGDYARLVSPYNGAKVTVDLTKSSIPEFLLKQWILNPAGMSVDKFREFLS